MKGLANQFGVAGVSLDFELADERRSLEESLYAVTRGVLRDAGLAIDDIDGIVVAANDQYDGRAISIMAASGSVGGVNRDIVSTPSAAEHAFIMGGLRVASGQFRTQLVLAWSPTEASSISEVQRLGIDPYFNRRLPLDELSTHALQAARICSVWPEAADLAAEIVAKNLKHGMRAYPSLAALRGSVDQRKRARPVRGELTAAMATPPGAGAVALVLASADFVRERRLQHVAMVEGMGWTTESSLLGDRDLADVGSLAVAAAQCYSAAGITDPARAFDLAEVSDATGFQELIAYEGLGLARREEAAARIRSREFAEGGATPVNLSGGSLTFNPVFCAGLARIAELANQIRGKAGPHQKKGATRGVAHAASGLAMQYNSVVVMGRAAAGEAA